MYNHLKARGKEKMTDFNDFVEELKKDKEFKAEYDALEEEFSALQNKIERENKIFFEKH